MIKLTRLIYVSRTSTAAERDLAQTVSDVLRVSRRNNAKAGVTGMLLTFRGHFIQALEGHHSSVEATLARVAGDERHTDVKVLGADFCTSRAFGRWAMCADTLSATDEDIVKVLDQRGAFQPYAMGSGVALKLLTSISAIHTRQLQATG